MPLSDEGREAIRKANQKRHITCARCGGVGTLRRRDGDEVGGLPGLPYLECGSCGYTRADTKRPRRTKAE